MLFFVSENFSHTNVVENPYFSLSLKHFDLVAAPLRLYVPQTPCPLIGQPSGNLSGEELWADLWCLRPSWTWWEFTMTNTFAYKKAGDFFFYFFNKLPWQAVDEIRKW